MKRLFTLLSLCVGFCLTANADVWKWVDAHGNTHFVDTMKPIYTWADEAGNLYFSDTPDHENAVVISPVWHSSETLDSMSSAEDEPDSGADTPPGESDEQRAERENAEENYREQATEILDSFVNASKLYRTTENGEREFLSEEEAAATIAETKVKQEELCR